MTERPLANSRFLAFYRGTETDHCDRTREEIVGWDNDRLEQVHDFIQWLFPLEEPSPVNPSAPVLTPADRLAFRQEPALRERLLESLDRMLAFYGFERHVAAHGVAIRKAADWAARSALWLHRQNHNHLRITRILKSLMLLGAVEEAAAFYRVLEDVYRSNRSKISAETMHFWTDAVTAEQTKALRGF